MYSYINNMNFPCVSRSRFTNTDVILIMPVGYNLVAFSLRLRSPSLLLSICMFYVTIQYCIYLLLQNDEDDDESIFLGPPRNGDDLDHGCRGRSGFIGHYSYVKGSNHDPWT